MPLDAYLPNSQPQKIPALANVFFLCLKQNSFHVALECSAMTLNPPLFTYLVDLKRQFEGHTNHFGMFGEVQSAHVSSHS